MLTLHHIPLDENLISSILMNAMERKIEIPEHNVIHTIVSARATVTSFLKENGREVTTGELYMHPFKDYFSADGILNWMNECDEIIQKLVGNSDEYAVIDEISTLEIKFQVTSVGGRGLVILKYPEKHLHIYII